MILYRAYMAKWQANIVISSNCWNFFRKKTTKCSANDNKITIRQNIWKMKLRGFYVKRTDTHKHIEMGAFSANAFKPPFPSSSSSSSVFCLHLFCFCFDRTTNNRECVSFQFQNNLNQHRQKGQTDLKQFHFVRDAQKYVHWNLGVFTILYKKRRREKNHKANG